MTIEPKIEIIPSNLQEYLDTFEINYETPKDIFLEHLYLELLL